VAAAPGCRPAGGASPGRWVQELAQGPGAGAGASRAAVPRGPPLAGRNGRCSEAVLKRWKRGELPCREAGQRRRQRGRRARRSRGAAPGGGGVIGGSCGDPEGSLHGRGFLGSPGARPWQRGSARCAPAPPARRSTVRGGRAGQRRRRGLKAHASGISSASLCRSSAPRSWTARSTAWEASLRRRGGAACGDGGLGAALGERRGAKKGQEAEDDALGALWGRLDASLEQREHSTEARSADGNLKGRIPSSAPVELPGQKAWWGSCQATGVAREGLASISPRKTAFALSAMHLSPAIAGSWQCLRPH